ncbi:hypothetical protein CTheo_7962 [Ceratobasidium theobromae]|uniref:Uncharacterized protein n=1 Tax=Ceratobasidium theobromae TaxID=1582974 RepID=A0A5N5QB11_9AGAM|nr:hypothetical protein CTheo_7962 [Ceratobasidium theobromae]
MFLPGACEQAVGQAYNPSLSEPVSSQSTILSPLHSPTPNISTMISPASIISKSKAPENSEWDRRNLFAHFSELASVQNHPALAHLPPMTSFPQTRWFLLSNEPRKIWETDGLIGGIQLLARNLDREWPEWAVSSPHIVSFEQPN